MSEVINRLIDIEMKAQEAVAESLEHKKRIEEEKEKLRKELEESIMQQANKKIAEIRNRDKDETEKKIEEIKKSMQEKLASMEKEIRENEDKWVNEIFARIIKG